MRVIMCALYILTTLLFYAVGLVSLHAEQPQRLSFNTNPGVAISPVKIVADLYLPKSDHKVPAMVIIHSSSGVMDQIEIYYAKKLVQNGIAALVVDSFTPRGVTATSKDQTLVTAWAMENDAFAALAELQKIDKIDPNKIGIMGVSKGGIVAQNSAFLVRRPARATGALEFALHVAIVPDCVTQQFNTVKTTGAPILFMLAEHDDLTPAKPCIDYAERIKEAGNKNVIVNLYPGQNHAWEITTPTKFIKETENYSSCASLIQDNGDYRIKTAGVTVNNKSVGEWMRQNCMMHGAHVGGGTQKNKERATKDLISFLTNNGF